ncbi:MAG: ChbG/HpnK family deacetylase, partial [Bryobacteraceae bacterium]
VGAHLALVGMPSALDGRPLPPTLRDLLGVLARRRLPVYEELKAQLEHILAAGIRPVHLDTHKHTHLIPQVLEAVLRLASEYGIRWIRRPFDWRWPGEPPAPWRDRLFSRFLELLRPGFDRRLAGSGCRATDYFAGLRMTGRFGASDLVAMIHALPEGATEFMCHPGRCGPELASARTRLKQSRERELAALTAPEVFEAWQKAGVRLAGRREL